MSKWQEIKLSDIQDNDWNYKTDNEDIQQKLINNLNNSGQLENIIVYESDNKYIICNGSHRLRAFQDLGYKKVMVYNLGKISEAEAKRIAVETNETKFNADHYKLSELLRELSEEFTLEELQETMPYSDEHFDNLLKEVQEPIPPEDSEFDKKIFLKVPEETYNIWLDWLDKLKLLTGIDNESRAFEYAIIEALNIPDESLKQ